MKTNGVLDVSNIMSDKHLAYPSKYKRFKPKGLSLGTFELSWDNFAHSEHFWPLGIFEAFGGNFEPFLR